MKGLLIALLLCALLLFPPTNALAGDPEVDITVSAFVVGTPSGLILTYINDYEVGIEWTKGEGAENTMIRACVSRAPESRTDGYLVYYGSAESCTDTGVSLDETAAPVVYRAWSQSAAGAWEEEGISDFIEGIGVIIIAFAVIIVALMALGFIFKNGLIFLVAGFAATGLGFILFGEDALSLKWMFGWVAIATALVCFIQALLVWMAQRPGPEMDEQEAYKRTVLGITRRKPRYPY